MQDCLILFTCLLFNRNSLKNLFCILTVFLAQFLHLFLFDSSSTAEVYYTTAIVFDLIAIAVMSEIIISDLSSDLQAILAGAMIANVLGYITFIGGYEPDSCNKVIQVLYIIQTIRMLLGDMTFDSAWKNINNRMDGWRSSFRYSHSTKI